MGAIGSKFLRLLPSAPGLDGGEGDGARSLMSKNNRKHIFLENYLSFVTKFGDSVKYKA